MALSGSACEGINRAYTHIHSLTLYGRSRRKKRRQRNNSNGEMKTLNKGAKSASSLLPAQCGQKQQKNNEDENVGQQTHTQIGIDPFRDCIQKKYKFKHFGWTIHRSRAAHKIHCHRWGEEEERRACEKFILNRTIPSIHTVLQIPNRLLLWCVYHFSTVLHHFVFLFSFRSFVADSLVSHAADLGWCWFSVCRHRHRLFCRYFQFLSKINIFRSLHF